MERGVPKSGRRCPEQDIGRDSPLPNGFGTMSHRTLLVVTRHLCHQRLPEVVLEQVGFKLYRSDFLASSKLESREEN